jgi:8-oxo-dGDP phosphatase
MVRTRGTHSRPLLFTKMAIFACAKTRSSSPTVSRARTPIVPVADDGCVYLVRQWRYPWRRNSWEIPAGHGEPNELPIDGAKRELAEEVGVQAETWQPLGSGYASATMNARYHLFLARGLSPAPAGHTRDGAEDDLIAMRVPLDEAVQAALDGRIEHSMSVVGLLRAARRLGL